MWWIIPALLACLGFVCFAEGEGSDYAIGGIFIFAGACLFAGHFL